MKVRCNNCMAIFDEEDITVDANDKEHCPKCGAEGYLMDLTDRRTYVHELNTAPSFLTGVKAGFKRALFVKEDDRTFNTAEQIILNGIDTVPEMLDKHVPPETGYKYFRERYGAILRDHIRKSEVIIEIGTKKYPYTRRMVKRYGLTTQADCSRCRHGGRA